jgi:hypothetical protein
MGGPHTVVKNPSLDKKSLPENTGLFFRVDWVDVVGDVVVDCFIGFSLYLKW